MNPSTTTSTSSLRRPPSKEYIGLSPKHKKLSSTAGPTDLLPKDPTGIGPFSPGGPTRASKTLKAAPVRLIPLSLEGRSKESLMGLKRGMNVNGDLESTRKYEPSHIAVIVGNRPISEEFAKEMTLNKHTPNLLGKPNGKWNEKTFKNPKLTPASMQEAEMEGNSTIRSSTNSSKFKSRLQKARVTEEDISKQFKKVRASSYHSDVSNYKEQVISELSQNNSSVSVNSLSSLKKSGMSIYGEMTLSNGPKDHSTQKQDFKNLTSPKIMEAADDSVDSVIIGSMINSKKFQCTPPHVKGKVVDSVDKLSPRRQMSIEKNLNKEQAQAQIQIQIQPPVEHAQPKKLFQNKKVQVGPGPMLFQRRPNMLNMFNAGAKPSLFNGNVTVVKSPMLQHQNGHHQNIHVEKIKVEMNGNGNGHLNGKEKEEKKEEEKRDSPKQIDSALRKTSLKKEHFRGEIRGNILKWKMGDFIGAGNFGQVYRAMEVESGRIIAVKSINNKDMLGSLEVELNILQNLQHKHIVQYLGHESIDNSLHIYLEYMSGGNINTIISKFGALPEKTVKVYAKQILAGLIYLHENKVVHKDIKGANILVDGDGTVKLADFGCSSQFDKTLSNFETFLASSFQGSIPWMAPEVVKETGYGRRSDIWSLGCTILEMATGKIPWSHYSFDNPVPFLMKIALSEEIPVIPDTLSEELKNFIGLCLQRDPTQRPHAQDLLMHPFLSNNN